MVRSGGGMIFFILYLLLGIYFLNFGITFIPKFTGFSSDINRWIIFAGGILLIFGGINFLKVNRYNTIRKRY